MDDTQNTITEEPTTEELLAQGFIRKTVPKYVYLVPWALIGIMATFVVMIMDYFVPLNGVNNNDKTITNTSNWMTVYECNEWFVSTENHVCQWTFHIENSGKFPIMFGIISSSTSNNKYPWLPPFYVISNSRKDINGQTISCSFSHALKTGDTVKVTLNIPKTRLIIKVNENEEFLVDENIICNDSIKYKCAVFLQNANDSVTLKDFNHSFECKQTESEILPNKEEASYNGCHKFEYHCDCGCNSNFDNYTFLKYHKFRVYETNGKWRDCECGSFHTDNNKTHALLHEFSHLARKPFACTVQTDGIKCTECFSQPNHLCYHINNVHYNVTGLIKPTESSYANVYVEPNESSANYENTTMFYGVCPGCDQMYSDECSWWTCIKSHPTLRQNGTKCNDNFKCNLLKDDGSVCEQVCKNKGIFVTHIGSKKDHKVPIRPLVCKVTENGISCGETYHTYQKKIFKKHKNQKHYENKEIIKK